VREIGEGLATSEVPELGKLGSGELALKPGKPAGKRGERLLVCAALSNIFEHLLQGLRGPAVERVGIGLVLFANAYRVHNNEAVLNFRARRHRALWRTALRRR
jgi:hypothetical protein